MSQKKCRSDKIGNKLTFVLNTDKTRSYYRKRSASVGIRFLYYVI